MKLTYEAGDQKITIETPHDDLTMEELYPLIQQLLLGAGFGDSTIKEYFEGE